MALTKEILDYIEASKEETLALLKDLCLIPAPSGMERAFTLTRLSTSFAP